jgi:hypothetical protein
MAGYIPYTVEDGRRLAATWKLMEIFKDRIVYCPQCHCFARFTDGYIVHNAGCNSTVLHLLSEEEYAEKTPPGVRDSD